jgi:hypothetical protein
MQFGQPTICSTGPLRANVTADPLCFRNETTAMPSSTYALFARAMAERKQVLCLYDGYPRALCPIILGHTKGEEVALVYQFAGDSKSGLPRGGQWKCLHLSKVTDASLRAGSWHTGTRHDWRQSCVDIVDLDVNPASPYRPQRRLDAAPRGVRGRRRDG